jgi:hypothetical protein
MEFFDKLVNFNGFLDFESLLKIDGAENNEMKN